MKKNYINKLFTLLGFLILAFVALNMNACSKDKNNNNHNPYQYGFGPGVPGGHLGNGIAQSPDGMTLQLSFAGQNGGQAGATGYLYVTQQGPGCAIYPGNYQVQTVQPGTYRDGDFYEIRLMTNNGMEIYIKRGWFENQQDQYGNRRMYVDSHIQGCPTVFN